MHVSQLITPICVSNRKTPKKVPLNKDRPTCIARVSVLDGPLVGDTHGSLHSNLLIRRDIRIMNRLNSRDFRAEAAEMHFLACALYPLVLVQRCFPATHLRNKDPGPYLRNKLRTASHVTYPQKQS